MKTLNFSKPTLRYLSKTLISSSTLILANPICCRSYSLVSSSACLFFCSHTYPFSYNCFLYNCHCYRTSSSLSSNGLSSASFIVYLCSQFSKSSTFSRYSLLNDDYTSQSLNFCVFPYGGYVLRRLSSLSSSHASRHKTLPTCGNHELNRPKATRKHVSRIVGLVITEDGDLISKLNALNVGLSLGSVNRIFQVLNREKKSGLKFFHWIRSWQPEFRVNSDLCSLIIDNCGRLGDYNAMRCLFKEFSSNNLLISKRAFNYLQVIARNEHLLKKATQDAVGIMQEVGGTSYGSGVRSLIEMLSELGLIEMSKLVIEKTGRKLSYFNILIKELCRKCDFEAARNLMDDMRNRGCNPSTETYNYIISSLLKNGKNADALKLFQEMHDQDSPPDAITFEIFIYNSCNEGKLDNAFEFFDDMVARGLKPRLLTHAAFIKGLFNSQQYEKAYKYVMDSNDAYSSNVNCSLLADLYLKRGSPVDAANILFEMIKKGLRPNFSVYLRVRKHLLSQSGNEKLVSDLQKQFCQLEAEA